MSETTIDLNRTRRMTVTINTHQGDTYYMTITGETDEKVHQQFEMLTDHDTVHLIVDNMIEQYARMEGYPDLQDESTQKVINEIMEEPAGDAPMSEHSIHISSDGFNAASAVITAPDQLKAATALLILGHAQQNENTVSEAPSSFGQEIPSIEEQLNDPDFFNKLKNTNDSDPHGPSSINF